MQAAARALSTIGESLAEQARATPHALAFLGSGRAALSYLALVDQISETVAALNRLGYGRDDRIAVVLPPGPENPAALVAVMTGCVAVPLNPAGTAAELLALFRRLRIAAVLTQPEALPNAAEAAGTHGIAVVELVPDTAREAGRFTIGGEPRGIASRTGFPSPDDLAVVFTTSGTTSVPKVIPLTQEVVCHRATRARRFVDLTAADRCLDLMPSFHGDAVFISILGSAFAGASTFYPTAAAPTDFWRWTTEVRPTWCALPPPYVEILARTDGGGALNPEMRAVFTCGAPVHPETIQAFEEKFGVPLQNSYGATECGGVTAQPLPPGMRKRGSVGTSIGLDVAIIEDEVVVRGPGVFGGYEGSPDGNAAAFVNDWYRTGDRGYIDADAFLFLTGRVTDVINRGGEKISPSEIDAVLRRHPAILDAVAFPVPHDTLGQDLAAAVVLRGSGASVAEIRAFATAHLAPFKVPRAIVIVPSIPAIAAGKVARASLARTFTAELAHASNGAAAGDAPRTATEERLARIWSAVLKTEHIGIHQTFAELDGDSLRAIEMLLQVEREFGAHFGLDQLWRSPTIASFAARLDDARTPRAPSLLITLQPALAPPSRPPLFWILPGWYLGDNTRLSRNLGTDQPFHALIPDARPGGGQHGLSEAEIVTACVAAIREVQPHGSYRLGGGSAGGLAAFAIAQRLHDEGEDVALLALLDTYYPGYPLRKRVPSPLRQIVEHAGVLASMERSEWFGYFLRYTGGRLRHQFRMRTGRGPTRQEAAQEMLATHLEQMFREEPRTYRGPIVMFAAEESPRHGFVDGRLHWSKVAENGLEVQLVPGNHVTIMRDPNVETLAAALRQRLDRVIDL